MLDQCWAAADQHNLVLFTHTTVKSFLSKTTKDFQSSIFVSN
jgi:hypothetical protein